MPYCKKCGCYVEDNAEACPSCGEKVRSNSAQDKVNGFLNTPDHASEFNESDMKSNKVVNTLAYLGITFWLPLLGEQTPDKRFHANQGLLILILSIVLGILSPVAGLIFSLIPFLGPVLAGLLNACISLAMLFYVLFGIINTVNDKAKELPLIGKITLLK